MPFKFAIAIPQAWGGNLEELYPFEPMDDVELPACRVRWFEATSETIAEGPFEADNELAVEAHCTRIYRPQDVPSGMTVYRINVEDLK